jgi:hypothetical protein
MRVKVQLVIGADDGGPDTIHDVAVLEKDCQRIEQLGLTLAEAKQLLTQLQQHVVAHQAAAFVTTRSQCEACGAPLQRKEETTRLLRTLFGTVLLISPRLYHCRCQAHKTATFRPLTALAFVPLFRSGEEYRATGVVLIKLEEDTMVQLDLFGETVQAGKLSRVYLPEVLALQEYLPDVC